MELIKGFTQIFLTLPEVIKSYLLKQDWSALDKWANEALQPNGFLYRPLSKLYSYEKFESLIAIRETPDENGIWHDDGSRQLGFSLSLNLENEKIQGGQFLLRKKMSEISTVLKTPEYGTLTIFNTGQNGFEHKTQAVQSGKRIMLVGWLD